MNGAGLFFLLLLLLVILPAAGWVGYTRWRAHQQGLPPPPLSSYIPFKKSSGSTYPVAPAPSGVVGWFQDKFQTIKNRGTGMQGSSAHARGRGSFAQLDPDGAWDDRVGNEADAYGRIGDYEEQELGVHPAYGGGKTAYGAGQTAYGSSSAGGPQHRAEESRGRSRNRDEDTAYTGAEPQPRPNPFGDDQEVNSLRGVSPRPVHDGDAHAEHDQGHRKQGSADSASIRTGRQSMFHEDM
jgi:hypothetical protein